MPAEKQNNISDKIDAMRELPEGFDFHPERVWKRLEPQLKKTTVNYRAVFFAAASFIAVIIFISLPAKRNEVTGKLSSKPRSVVAKKETNNNSRIPDREIKRTASTKHNSRINEHSVHPFLPQSVLAEETAILPVNEIKKDEQQLPVEIKTQPVVTAMVKQKRKFPIAHVNELNTNVPVESEQQSSYTKTSFALRKRSFENVTSPVSNSEEGFTERKKPKSIFPLLNSSQ